MFSKAYVLFACVAMTGCATLDEHGPVRTPDNAITIKCAETNESNSEALMIIACQLTNETDQPVAFKASTVNLTPETTNAVAASPEAVQGIVSHHRSAQNERDKTGGFAAAALVVAGVGRSGGSSGGGAAAAAIVGVGAAALIVANGNAPDRQTAQGAVYAADHLLGTGISLPPRATQTKYLVIQLPQRLAPQRLGLQVESPVAANLNIPIALSQARTRQRPVQ